MNRIRKFNHDECRALYATGTWSHSTLAERFGVSPSRIGQVVNPALGAAAAERLRKWQADGRCTDCGTRCTRRYDKNGRRTERCISCAAKARASSVGESSLRCMTCQQWKDDEAFPLNRAQSPLRRGRHGTCRACQTVLRRSYRNARKVPCSHGCGTLVLHENGGKNPECHPCAMRRIHEERALAIA